MKRSYSMMVTMLVAGVLTGGLALSSEGIQGQEKSLLTAKLSMEEAITAAKTKFPGQVREAELENKDGQTMYEIEIASTAGTITEIKVDAQTGELVASETKKQEDHEQEESEVKDHE